MNACPIILAGVRYTSKEEVKRKVQTILYGYDIGQDLSEEDQEFMWCLLQRHPRVGAKEGPGVQQIRIAEEAIWHGRIFEIVRLDGSVTDFSYRKCLWTPTPMHHFLDACRSEVVDQILDFKKKMFKDSQALVCPVTGELVYWGNCHVDHEAPMTFEQIVKDFVRESSVDVRSVHYVGWEDGAIHKRFANSAIAELWRDFHKAHARLRITSVKGNLGGKRV